jgi:ribonucleoside-diphosphate reductase alpha chain
MGITITKRDGTREVFDADKINKSIARACEGLPEQDSLVMQIASETRLTMYDGMTTEEMDRATIDAAVQNIKDDPAFDKAATRLLLKVIYKRALGAYETQQELKRLYRERFSAYIDRGIALGLLDARLKSTYDLSRLAEAINPERDELFTYTGLDTILKRYSIREAGEKPLEPPQYSFMRIAMGLALNEKDPNDWVIRFYEKMSKHEYIAGGSTNIGSGTPTPKLSNCFLIDMQDDMEHIAKTVADVLLLSKASGGIGMTVTRLRANGSPLGASNSVSSGPVPFLHIVDASIHAIVRGGKKKGALCFYMEPWHMDIDDFINLKQNAGDDYRRTRTADTAVYIPDEFMRRVRAEEEWYLFDPKETSDLIDLYGNAFAKRYAEYVAMAEAGKLHMWKKLPATELWRRIIVSLQTTSHPWITWKDTINLRALNNNTGTINGSNLCTEITLPHDRNNTAVCNLISVNLARHIRTGAIEWQKLEQSVRLAVRQLDDLVDINILPVAEAVRSDSENRAIGMGIMGFSDALEQLGLPYDSEGAYDFADKVMEFISYMAIDESARLATERGSYANFEGSGWSKGMVPIDTLSLMDSERGFETTVKHESAHRGLDWNVLREKVKKGMRNATLLAIAPNANIGLVAGTSPGIDPRFTQMFSRSKYSGKYMEVNQNLVHALRARGLWEKVRDRILESHGDIADIDDIPDDIKMIYKTSFSLPATAFVEVAARAQKWIDQAISRNMYLATRDTDETMNIYMQAWEKGLKTTYYLHMKPRHSAEQSTVKVNKSVLVGKKGFGVLNMQNGEGESVLPVGFAQAALLMPESAVPEKSAPMPTSMPQSTPVSVSAPARFTPKPAPSTTSAAAAAPIVASKPAMPRTMTPEKELMSAMTAANYPLEQENVAVKANTPGAKVGFGAVAGSVGAAAVGSSAPVRPRPNIADITPNNIGDDLVDPNELNVCDSCQ